jgi:hypothetical protein
MWKDNRWHTRFQDTQTEVWKGEQMNTVNIANPLRGKNNQVVGRVIAVVSFIILAISFFAESSGMAVFAAFGLSVGSIIFVIGRIQNWYHWK